LCGFLLLGMHHPLSVAAKTLATIVRKGAKKSARTVITLKEFQTTYSQIKQLDPNAPTPTLFWETYLSYRIGVEEAYNTPSLVKSPKVRWAIVDPMLKESFEQMLYKMLAENNLKRRIASLEQRAQKLSKKTLLTMYNKNPEYSFQSILISVPSKPSQAQLQEANSRAQKIYNDVKKSKRTFTNLVGIYSDDKISGKIGIPRARTEIHPAIYKQLVRMKDGAISPPIRTALGFQIVRRHRKIPFGEADRYKMKLVYFDLERARMLKKYFSKIRSKYTVKVNQSLLSQVQ